MRKSFFYIIFASDFESVIEKTFSNKVFQKFSKMENFLRFRILKVVKNISLNTMKDFLITKRDGSQDQFSLDR